MRIEFNTVYDNFANEKLAQLYVKYFMEKQQKNYKKTLFLAIAVAIVCAFVGIMNENYIMPVVGIVYFVLVFILLNHSKKKVLPKSFIEHNGVGCPYNVTFGLYDEYFYEKFENNMSISEQSVRYEFLKKIMETPEYFILMTKRSQLYFLPKKDMGYEAVLEFSAFCKSRLPYIYKIGD